MQSTKQKKHFIVLNQVPGMGERNKTGQDRSCKFDVSTGGREGGGLVPQDKAEWNKVD
jgi:hypothetical protein